MSLISFRKSDKDVKELSNGVGVLMEENLTPEEKSNSKLDIQELNKSSSTSMSGNESNQLVGFAVCTNHGTIKENSGNDKKQMPYKAQEKNQAEQTIFGSIQKTQTNQEIQQEKHAKTYEPNIFRENIYKTISGNIQQERPSEQAAIISNTALQTEVYKNDSTRTFGENKEPERETVQEIQQEKNKDTETLDSVNNIFRENINKTISGNIQQESSAEQAALISNIGLQPGVYKNDSTRTFGENKEPEIETNSSKISFGTQKQNASIFTRHILQNSGAVPKIPFSFNQSSIRKNELQTRTKQNILLENAIEDTSRDSGRNVIKQNTALQTEVYKHDSKHSLGENKEPERETVQEIQQEINKEKETLDSVNNIFRENINKTISGNIQQESSAEQAALISNIGLQPGVYKNDSTRTFGENKEPEIETNSSKISFGTQKQNASIFTRHILQNSGAVPKIPFSFNQSSIRKNELQTRTKQNILLENAIEDTSRDSGRNVIKQNTALQTEVYKHDSKHSLGENKEPERKTVQEIQQEINREKETLDSVNNIFRENINKTISGNIQQESSAEQAALISNIGLQPGVYKNDSTHIFGENKEPEIETNSSKISFGTQKQNASIFTRHILQNSGAVPKIPFSFNQSSIRKNELQTRTKQSILLENAIEDTSRDSGRNVFKRTSEDIVKEKMFLGENKLNAFISQDNPFKSALENQQQQLSHADHVRKLLKARFGISEKKSADQQVFMNNVAEQSPYDLKTNRFGYYFENKKSPFTFGMQKSTTSSSARSILPNSDAVPKITFTFDNQKNNVEKQLIDSTNRIFRKNNVKSKEKYLPHRQKENSSVQPVLSLTNNIFRNNHVLGENATSKNNMIQNGTPSQTNILLGGTNSSSGAEQIRDFLLTGALSKAGADHYLSDDELRYIKDQIIKAILSAGPVANARGYETVDGSLVIKCASETNFDWIKTVVKRIPMMDNSRLVFTRIDNKYITYKNVIGWVSDCELKTKDILACFEVQNPGIRTNLWKVLSYRKKKNKDNKLGLELVIRMEQDSVDMLTFKYKNQLNMFFGVVKFTIESNQQK